MTIIQLDEHTEEESKGARMWRRQGVLRQPLGPAPSGPDSVGLGGQDALVLTSSSAMLRLLVQAPHFDALL